jgi:5,10-methylene-tetrahydrofolate dehydrogenase/methenyl tetrahydrofolate cyclohydrolase
MKTNKNIGLVECNSKGEISTITSNNNPDGYVVKKIMTANKVSGDIAMSQFPEAQLVDDINSIIQDSAIDLILVSKPKRADMNMVGEAVKAGKNVRII